MWPDGLNLPSPESDGIVISYVLLEPPQSETCSSREPHRPPHRQTNAEAAYITYMKAAHAMYPKNDMVQSLQALSHLCELSKPASHCPISSVSQLTFDLREQHHFLAS